MLLVDNADNNGIVVNTGFICNTSVVGILTGIVGNTSIIGILLVLPVSYVILQLVMMLM